MNLTSIPKINFYKSTPIPSPRVEGGSRGLVKTNFFKLDPDIVNQQRTRTPAGFRAREGIKGAARGAAFGAGLTTATIENVVKGFVASIFRKQQERNVRRERRTDVQKGARPLSAILSLTPVINAGTRAVNGLGATVNGVGSTLSNLLRIEQKRLKAEKDANANSYKATFDKREKIRTGKSGLGDVIFRTGGKFWEAITGLLSGFLKYFFIRPILEWLADPSNKEKIVGILNTLKKVFDVIYGFTKGRIVGIIDGLAKTFDSNMSWKDRLTGLFGALGNLGLLLLGIRWLSNPLRIIKDVGTVLGIFRGALGTMLKFLSVPFKLLGGALNLATAPLRAAMRNPKAALALTGVAAATGFALKRKYDDDEEFRTKVDENFEGAKDWTQERWNELNTLISQGRENLRGDQDSIADNLIQQGEKLRQSVVQQSADTFNNLTGRQNQVAPEVTPIGGDQTVENYLRDYTQQLTSEVGERLNASDEQVNYLSDFSQELLDNNKNFIETIQEQFEGLNLNLPERSMGGILKLPSKDKGGYIHGPKSGYPVSLSGGKTPSFIGHGTEYVSKKRNGDAFVIPIDTPHTDRNPNLQIRRTQEAQKQGFNLNEFSEGGGFNLFKPSTWGNPFVTPAAPVGTPSNPFRFTTPQVQPSIQGLNDALRNVSATFAPELKKDPVVPIPVTPYVAPTYAPSTPDPVYTPATDSRNAEYIKLRDQGNGREARDYGMLAWAKANPELAKKLKPGDAGYDIINPKSKTRSLVSDSAPAIGQSALNKLRKFTGQSTPTQQKKPNFFSRLKNFFGLGQQQQQQPQQPQKQQRQVPWSQLPPEIQRRIPPPIWADQPVNLPTGTFVPSQQGGQQQPQQQQRQVPSQQNLSPRQKYLLRRYKDLQLRQRLKGPNATEDLNFFLQRYGGRVPGISSPEKRDPNWRWNQWYFENIKTDKIYEDIIRDSGIQIPEFLKNTLGFSQGGSFESAARKYRGNPKDFALDPILSQSVPLLYRMLQSGRFAKKGWGNKNFLNNLTGQILHETAGGTRARELYNTSPSDPKGKPGYQYFSGYSGMLGNRNADDAYQYRGRGPLQLTGRSNYQGFNTWLQRNGYKDYDILSNPSLIENDPKVQALSSLYYLEDREKTFPDTNFASAAAKGDVREFTYNINGGYTHLDDRIRATNIASQSNIDYGTGFKPVTAQTKPTPQPTPQPQSPFGGLLKRLGFSDGGEISDNKLFGFKAGGYLPKMEGPQIRMDDGPYETQYVPRGGWITGPITGYPVSVKGKNRPDFIAHGTEYVSKKSTGEYTVLPYHGRGGELEKLSFATAGLEGFDVPTKVPTASSFLHPTQETASIRPGVKGNFLQGLWDGVKSFFGGGSSNKDSGGGGGGGSSSGGGGGGFWGNLVSGVGNIVGGLFGGGSSSTSSGSGGNTIWSTDGSSSWNYGSSGGGIDFGNIFGGSSNTFDFGTSLGSTISGSSFGAYNTDAYDFGGLGNFDIGNIFGGGSQQKPGYMTIQDQARAMGNKWGLQYDEKGNVRMGSILPAIFRQAGGLGKEIGKIFGGDKGGALGGSIGNALFTIFGGGGSGQDGKATFGDIISSAGGVLSQVLKDKDGLLGDIGKYTGIFFGPGSEQFTFGEKVALALNDALSGTPYGKYVRPIAQALGVDVANSVNYAKMINGESPFIGPGGQLAAAAGDVPPSAGLGGGGAQGFGDDVGMEGGGKRAAIEGGKLALGKGLTVFNHPNFRNNKWSEMRPNQGKGYMPGGGEKVSGDAKHAQGIAMLVGDFRPDSGRDSRLISFADDSFTFKQDRKLTGIAFDDWGKWSLGGKREGPGKYGHPEHVYLQYAKNLMPGSGGTLGDPVGGLDQIQAGAIGRAVQNIAPSGASIVEKAAIANTMTNQAQNESIDLSNVLGNYGVNTESFTNQFDKVKIESMFNDTTGTGITFMDGLGLDLGLDNDFSKYMNLSGDPNALYKSAVSSGVPPGEAENMVNATEVFPVSGGLQFSSEKNTAYAPPAKIPQPATFSMGSGSGPTLRNAITDTSYLSDRNFNYRTTEDDYGETASAADDTTIVPFIAPEEDQQSSSKRGGGAANYLSPGNNVFAAPQGGAAGMPDMGGMGGMGNQGGATGQGGQQPAGDAINNTVRTSEGQRNAQQNSEEKNAKMYAVKERMFGQERINEQSQSMVQNAIARVEAINAEVRQAVAQAQQAVAKAIQSSNSGGGGGVGSAAASMVSAFNGSRNA